MKTFLSICRALIALLFLSAQPALAQQPSQPAPHSIRSARILKDQPYATVRGFWSSSKGRDDNILRQALKLPKAISRRDLTLCMDIYLPASPQGPRPLVLLMHGGAFWANSKTSEPSASLCRALASNGCVAASIDYRMGFRISRKSIARAGDDALEDASAALAYLLARSEELGIDSSRVVLGGSSSGAMTVLKLAADPSRLGCNVVGIIDMWGAVERLDLLDGTDASLIAFHGDRDTIVPYDEGYPVGGKAFMPYLWGAKPLVEHRLSIGKQARLVTFPGYSHAPHRDKDHSLNQNYNTLEREIIEFVASLD